MPIETKKVIAEIQNTDSTVIKFTVVSDGKEDYLDIRQWVNSDSYSGPTKKGIWLRKSVLKEIGKMGLIEAALKVMKSGEKEIHLTEKQKTAIGEIVRELGSMEKVELKYKRDDSVCAYAKQLAREIF